MFSDVSGSDMQSPCISELRAARGHLFFDMVRHKSQACSVVEAFCTTNEKPKPTLSLLLVFREEGNRLLSGCVEEAPHGFLA